MAQFGCAIPGQTDASRRRQRLRDAAGFADADATPSARTLIDSMDSADLKEAIQLLKNNYIKPEALNETELSRAAFEGILARLGRGVVLLAES